MLTLEEQEERIRLVKKSLRATSVKWSVRQVLLEAKRRTAQNKPPGARYRWEYPCAFCKEWFKYDGIEIDHIHDVENASDWNEFVEFLFCGPEGLQILCKGCHLVKTKGLKSECRSQRQSQTDQG